MLDMKQKEKKQDTFLVYMEKKYIYKNLFRKLNYKRPLSTPRKRVKKYSKIFQ